jgi:hypothetical protein
VQAVRLLLRAPLAPRRPLLLRHLQTELLQQVNTESSQIRSHDPYDKRRRQYHWTTPPGQ